MDGQPGGHAIFAALVDEQLRTTGSNLLKLRHRDRLPEGDTAGTYGCSGVRWVLETDKLPPEYHPGQIIRIFEEGWPARELAETNHAQP
jgi:hypothetical protein